MQILVNDGLGSSVRVRHFSLEVAGRCIMRLENILELLLVGASGVGRSEAASCMSIV